MKLLETVELEGKEVGGRSAPGETTRGSAGTRQNRWNSTGRLDAVWRTSLVLRFHFLLGRLELPVSGSSPERDPVWRSSPHAGEVQTRGPEAEAPRWVRPVWCSAFPEHSYSSNIVTEQLFGLDLNQSTLQVEGLGRVTSTSYF